MLAAEDARVTFLQKQLSGAKDPRVRAQTLLLLGQTGSDSAVSVVCGAMKDPEAVVRTAAATALGELRTESSIACLKAVSGETDSSVRAAMDKALAQGAVTAGALYLQVEPVQDKVGDLPGELVALAEKVMREKLNGYGANFAPPNEDKKSAASLIRAKKLKGYQLRMQLLPGSTEKGLKVEMLIMSYPEQALKGTWNVKAAGGKPESLIKAMVPRVVDDAAADLEWKN
ncbi:MAG: HEAT repeat domain-containing protein [Myxococcota bacterium]